MDRREFLRKITSDSAKVWGGSALGCIEGSAVLGQQWMSAIENQLLELKHRSDLFIEDVGKATVDLELRISEAVHLVSSEFSRSLRQQELRLSGLERQQIIMFLWLLTLSVVTGVDFVSSSMSLFYI